MSKIDEAYKTYGRAVVAYLNGAIDLPTLEAAAKRFLETMQSLTPEEAARFNERAIDLAIDCVVENTPKATINILEVEL